MYQKQKVNSLAIQSNSFTTSVVRLTERLSLQVGTSTQRQIVRFKWWPSMYKRGIITCKYFFFPMLLTKVKTLIWVSDRLSLQVSASVKLILTRMAELRLVCKGGLNQVATNWTSESGIKMIRIQICVNLVHLLVMKMNRNMYSSMFSLKRIKMSTKRGRFSLIRATSPHLLRNSLQ